MGVNTCAPNKGLLIGLINLFFAMKKYFLPLNVIQILLIKRKES